MKTLLQRFNILVIFMVASLISLGSLAALVPDRALAAIPDESGPKGTFYQLPVADQATVWSKYKLATGTFNSTSGDACTLNDQGISENDIRSGMWFGGLEKRIGHHVVPEDGRANCNNEHSWFSSLLDQAGYAGDYITPAKTVFDIRNGYYYPKADAGRILANVLADKLFGGRVPGTSDAVNYGILLGNFTAGKACGAAPLVSQNAGANYEATVEIQYYDPAKKAVAPQLFGYNNPEGDISVGPGLTVPGGDDQSMECKQIAQVLAADAKYANAVQGCIDSKQCGGLNSSATNTPGDDPNLQCGTMWNPLNWYICPVIKGINAMVNTLDNGINSLLAMDDDKIFNRCTTANDTDCSSTASGYYAAWESFRGIALGILVVAAIGMLIAQGFGFEFLDAYTIKKILPRLVIAIIGIALSWELMRFFVEFTNDLGYGIRQIIYFPFKGLNSSLQLGGGATVAVTLLTGAGLLGLGIIGLLSFAATALLAVAIAFLVLILRQLIIIVLILLAPIAIACYILPNTQGAWKLWSDSFIRALLMFPIIVAFLAVGRVFALVTMAPDNGAQVSAIYQLVGFAAYFLPYFLIPLTFRFAGGVMRTIGGFTNDQGRGGFDRLRKFRQGQFQQHGGRRIGDLQTEVMQKRSQWYEGLQKRGAIAGASGTRAAKAKKRLYNMAAGQVGGYNIEERMSAKRAQTGKQLNEQIATGRDDEIRALTVNKDWADEQWKTNEFGEKVNNHVRFGKDGNKQYKSLGGFWVDETKVDAAYKRWGGDTFAQQAALSYEMRKASSEDEIRGIAENYNQVAAGSGGWGMSDYEAYGSWVGAAFENQQTHLSFKKTNWKDGKMEEAGQTSFVNELYNKKGAYPMAQMSSYTIEQLKTAYTDADAREKEAMDKGNAQGIRNAQDMKRKIQGISETFMTRYGGGAAVGDPNDPQSIAIAQQEAAQQQIIAAAAERAAATTSATGTGQQAGQQEAAQQAAARARQGTFQMHGSGAAAVNERLRELTVMTGVYRGDLPAYKATSDNPGIDPATGKLKDPIPQPDNKRQT